MKILFTKKISPVEVSKYLDAKILYESIPAIETKSLCLSPFALSGKSLIFTSVAGVQAFFENGFQAQQDFTQKDFNKIYAVGEKTKKELRKHGFESFKTELNAALLAKFLLKHADGEHLLHFCGNLALPIFPLNDNHGMRYERICVYETHLLYPILDNQYDAVVFFSPSGVKSVCQNNKLQNCQIYSIGRTTTAQLLEYVPKENIITSTKSSLKDILLNINRNYHARTKNTY